MVAAVLLPHIYSKRMDSKLPLKGGQEDYLTDANTPWSL